MLLPPPVLIYHEITRTPGPDPNSTTVGLLRLQLELLLKKGYAICSIRDLVNEKSDSGRRVGLTFDDGYESFYSLVTPLLNELGIGATVFIPSDCLIRQDLMRYRTMSVEQATSVVSDGFEVGSHGKSHKHLTRLGQDALEEELDGSRKTIAETLHAEVYGLSYPFGAANGRVVSVAKSAGYHYACASSMVPLRELLRFNRCLMPRIDVSRRTPEIACAFVRGFRTIVRGESVRSYPLTLKNWREA